MSRRWSRVRQWRCGLMDLEGSGSGDWVEGGMMEEGDEEAGTVAGWRDRCGIGGCGGVGGTSLVAWACGIDADCPLFSWGDSGAGERVCFRGLSVGEVPAGGRGVVAAVDEVGERGVSIVGGWWCYGLCRLFV
ncbi:hypothetical protein CIHG_00552 [Coccidioides immitis H538.4]|uniref:Uncharacterized protein n=1 Tax=Coccidioides immitis H538.4 TaxID=396776 RepID=A0A0J8RC43_COCIT|nr:hypothetical protein CIHG_00552 [Coccidioides immitis H538.4]